MAKAYALDEEGMRRFQKMWKWMRNFTVTGAKSFRNTEDSCSILIGGAESSPSSTKSDTFLWVRIGANTQDGTNKRWKYDWTEVVKSSSGYGGWAAGGLNRSGHGSTYDYAYNAIEDINGATGTWGNGVSSTNLTGSLTIKPVPASVVVPARIVYPTGSAPEVWFAYENGIDGGCT